jgi:hypothetical protein
MFDRKFILYILFSKFWKLQLLFFTQRFCSIIPSQSVLWTLASMFCSCCLAAHVPITDKLWSMNGLLFHFSRREGHSYNELHKHSPRKLSGNTVFKYQLLSWKAVFRQYNFLETNISQSRSLALLAMWRLIRWRYGVDKRHSRTNNREFLCNMTLRYWIAAFLQESTPYTWHNILLAEEVSQCPLASSRWDIVVDRAGVRPLAACSILMRRLVTFSHDTLKLFRIVRSSKWENILSCKGLNPCSVIYNILPRGGQWTLANLLSQQNIGKNRSIMTKCMKSV